MMILEANYAAGDVFTLEVTYNWKSSGDIAPEPDYTVKVYSSQSLIVLNSTSHTNKIYFDGHLPSGFTSSTFSISSAEFPSDTILSTPAKKVPRSLTNLFEIATTPEEWNELFWENPWVVLWWFG